MSILLVNLYFLGLLSLATLKRLDLNTQANNKKLKKSIQSHKGDIMRLGKTLSKTVFLFCLFTANLFTLCVANANTQHNDIINQAALALLPPPIFDNAQRSVQIKQNNHALLDNDLNFKRHIFSVDLVNAALERLNHKVTYDGSYRQISFPGGDVPNNIGVCTDVVIRAYRRLGIDLQERVNHDMRQHFFAYPNLPKWNLYRPDTNIDHRRVLNLQVFFKRQGASLPISLVANDYLPGDLVTWNIRPGMPHIGIVTPKVSKDKKRPLIVHNIGEGPQLEDILFTMEITGHYRYQPGLQYNPSLNYQVRN